MQAILIDERDILSILMSEKIICSKLLPMRDSVHISVVADLNKQISRNFGKKTFPEEFLNLSEVRRVQIAQ